MNIHYSLDSYEFYNKISEVIILDIIPCKSFPIIYGFIDIFSFDVILITCNRIDIPPKPNKKEAIIMLILENLNKERLFSPLVNSTIPISIEESISLEIPNKPNNGANMLEVRVKIWLFSNMEHTTEKRTTKPPTTRMELILLDTLFDKISPKFEKETFEEELSKVKSLYKFFSKFFFHHLKQKPTIRQEIICDIRRITRIFTE